MKILVCVTLLLEPVIAVAGMFSSSVSDADAVGIHRIAVYSILGDSFRGVTRGLTVLSKKEFVASVPQWGIDAAVTEHAVATIQQGGGHLLPEPLAIGDAKVEWKAFGQYDGVTHAGLSTLLNRARLQGVDALLVIERSTNVHAPWFPAGYGLSRGGITILAW